MPDDVRGAVTAKTQAVLLESLYADIDLAFTFLDTAKIDIMDHPDRARELLGKVRTALQSVRHLSSHIQDHNRRQEIHARANELETALHQMSI